MSNVTSRLASCWPPMPGARGKVYTVCRGDEPAEARILVDYARDLPSRSSVPERVEHPLNPSATPESLTAEAVSKHMNPKMCAASSMARKP